MGRIFLTKAIFIIISFALLTFNNRVLAGKLFIFTTPSTPDGKITFSEEAREYVADK